MAGPWDGAINQASEQWRRFIDAVMPEPPTPAPAPSVSPPAPSPSTASTSWQSFIPGLSTAPTMAALPTPSFFGGTLPAAGSLPMPGIPTRPEGPLSFLPQPDAAKAPVTAPAPAAPTPSPVPATLASNAGSFTAETPLEQAIDKHSAGDAEVALSMRLAVLLEGGSFEGGWQVGDAGQSYGPYQIHQPGNTVNGRPLISVADSQDPDKATAFMAGRFRAARDTVKQRYGADIFQRDPMRAAMLTAGFAEKPYMWGQNPDNPYPLARAQSAWAQLNRRKTQPQQSVAPAADPIAQAAAYRIGGLTPYQFAADTGLSTEDAASACGPAAAIAFARYTGRNPTFSEAVSLAKEVGWNPAQGMAGPASQVKLLEKMGIAATLTEGVDWNRVAAEVQAGKPVILDTPGHYFVVEGYDAATGRFNFAASAKALKASNGNIWYRPEQLDRLGVGKVRSAIYLA